MNIVIVNHYAGSPHYGMEFRPYYLGLEWKKKGHNVLIIGASFSHLRFKQPKINSTLQSENLDGLDYLWIKTNRYSGNGFGRIISMFLFTVRLFILAGRIFNKFKPDLLIASSTYPLDNISVNILAKKYAAMHCYEVHDLWPLSLIELGGYSKYHPFIMFIQWAENFAYKNADFVISMLPKTLEHMKDHGLVNEKFKYIPNGVQISDWTDIQIPKEHTEFITNLRNEDNSIIVGYAGGHAISNALEYLIEAAAIAQISAPNLKFVLVGGGNEKNRLIEKAKNAGLHNISFLAPISKREIPMLLSSMDILYLGWHHNPLYRFGISPNKLIDYMMSGKPIVHSVNAANDLVQESNCGISVQPENPQKIVDALIKLSKMNESQRSTMGINGKEFVIKKHNYEILAEDFITFAKKISNRTNHYVESTAV